MRFLQVFLIVFILVMVWPRDVYPKLFVISQFIHNEDSYKWAQNYCSHYKSVYKRNCCREYITEKYIGKK